MWPWRQRLVMLPQIKECLGPVKLEEAKENPPLEAPQGVWRCQHLDFGFLASRTVGDKCLWFCDTQFAVLYDSPRKIIEAVFFFFL